MFSYTIVCPFIRGDNPRAFASPPVLGDNPLAGFFPVQADKPWYNYFIPS